MSSQLAKTTVKSIDRSSSSPPTKLNAYAKVVSVHDGDTCDLVFDRNGTRERFKSRLLGIDTPELNTNFTGPPEALKARDFLAWLCIGGDAAKFPSQSSPWSDSALQQKLDNNQNLVYAEFNGTGGKGRPLVTLKSQPGSSKSFNTLLVEKWVCKGIH